MTAKGLSSFDIATMVGGRLVGETDAILTGVEALEQAGRSDVSFLGNAKYRGQVLPSKAAVVLVPTDFDIEPPDGRAWVVCDQPSDAFTRLVDHFAPPSPPGRAGIHPAAVVSDNAEIADSVTIGPNAVIEAKVVVGPNSVISAGCFVGYETKIGASCLIHPNVTIRERCVLGDRVIIHSGTVVGSDGFGYITGDEGHKKIPQVGIVQIDDDVEIGAQVAIDRARFGKTWIKKGAKIDNLVQIAHNVVVGENSIIVALVGISGSTHLGKGVVAAGQVGITGHLRIGDGVTMMAKAGVTRDIPDGQTVGGQPAVPRRQFAKSIFAVNSIDKLKERVKALEKEIQQLKETTSK